MISINVTIEPGKDGFGVMFKSKKLEHITSFGETIAEAKANARNAVKEYIAYCNETGKELPTVLKGIDIDTITFRYNLKQ